MAEIIRFPQRSDARAAALRVLAGKIAAHLTVVFLERKILHIPIQAYLDDMLNNLLSDGLAYDIEILTQIGDDPEMMVRFEKVFFKLLLESGHLEPEDLQKH